MSKWSEEFEGQLKDVKTVKEATRDVIKQGGKLLAEKYHEASSLEKLKKEIMKRR